MELRFIILQILILLYVVTNNVESTLPYEDDIQRMRKERLRNTPVTTLITTTSVPMATSTQNNSSILYNIPSIGWTLPVVVTLTALCCLTGVNLFLFYSKRKSVPPRPETVELLPRIPSVENEYYEHLYVMLNELQYDPAFEVPRDSVKFGEFIASGHFGEVYEGTLSRQSNRTCLLLSLFQKQAIPVAIKMSIADGSPEDVELRKRLLNEELKLMCNVGFHPYVIALLGSVTKDCPPGVTLIVMEKCSTLNLMRYLKTKKNNFIPQFEKEDHDETPSYGYLRPDFERYDVISFTEYKQLVKKRSWKSNRSKDLTTAHLLSFAMQIAKGMEYLSSNRCVHRDLAARNILLSLDEFEVKIADFGLAKRIGYSGYYRAASEYDLPWRWMSLESLQELRFSVESDVWSYGILLHEIFTLGGMPYDGFVIKNNEELIEELLKGTRNYQSKYCPPEIYHHMTNCWAIEKEKRPSFRKLAQLMRIHLSRASKDMLEKVTKLYSEREEYLSSLQRHLKSRDYSYA